MADQYEREGEAMSSAYKVASYLYRCLADALADSPGWKERCVVPMDIADEKTQDVRGEIRITWYDGPKCVRDQVCTDAINAAAAALGVSPCLIRRTDYPTHPTMKSFEMSFSGYRYPDGTVALLPETSPMVETQETPAVNTQAVNAPNNQRDV